MKAVVFKETGNWQEVLQLKEIEIPEPAADEVQVKITARPINPSDEMFIGGIYRKKPQLPQIAGLEGAGIIVKSNDDPSLTGKQVVFRTAGTWAERINLRKDQYHIIPNHIPAEIACQLSLNTLTAFALLEESKVNNNDWLLITAASGSVARQLIQAASVQQVKTIALVRSDEQKQKLLTLGASAVINTERENLAAAVQVYAPGGVKAAIDAVGGAIGSSLYKIMAPFGTLIIYGRLSDDPVHYFNADVIYRNLNIKGFGIDAWISSKKPAELSAVWEKMIRLVETGAIKIPVDHIQPVNNFSSAIKDYKTTSAKHILADSQG